MSDWAWFPDSPRLTHTHLLLFPPFPDIMLALMLVEKPGPPVPSCILCPYLHRSHPLPPNPTEISCWVPICIAACTDSALQ